MARSIEILVELKDGEGLTQILEAAERVAVDLLGQEHPDPR
jgi:hypothetical protein